MEFDAPENLELFDEPPQVAPAEEEAPTPCRGPVAALYRIEVTAYGSGSPQSPPKASKLIYITTKLIIILTLVDRRHRALMTLTTPKKCQALLYFRKYYNNLFLGGRLITSEQNNLTFSQILPNYELRSRISVFILAL